MNLDDLLWQISKIERLRFWYQISRRGRKSLFYVFIGLNNAVAIFFIGLVAWYSSWPLIFPSLGPSLFLIFYAPKNPMSCPRNTLLGHLIGGIIGFLSFKLGVYGGFFQGAELNLAHVVFLSIALGLCGIAMTITNLLHAPAASTCLIGALGLIPHWYFIPLLTGALVLVIIQAVLIHRLAGVVYPWWAPFSSSKPSIKLKSSFFDFEEDREEHLNQLAKKLASAQKNKNFFN